MKVYGDAEFNLEWLDGGDPPLYVIDSATKAALDTLQQFGADAGLVKNAGCEWSVLPTEQGKKNGYGVLHCVVESNGSGILTVWCTLSKERQMQAYTKVQAKVQARW